MNNLNEKPDNRSEQAKMPPDMLKGLPGAEEPATDLQTWLKEIQKDGGEIAKEASLKEIRLDPDQPNLADVQKMLNQTTQGYEAPKAEAIDPKDSQEDLFDPETEAKLVKMEQNVAQDELINEPAIAEPFIKDALTILVKDMLTKAENNPQKNIARTINNIIISATNTIKKNDLMYTVFTSDSNKDIVINTLTNIFENISFGSRKADAKEAAILVREFARNLTQ